MHIDESGFHEWPLFCRFVSGQICYTKSVTNRDRNQMFKKTILFCDMNPRRIYFAQWKRALSASHGGGMVADDGGRFSMAHLRRLAVRCRQERRGAAMLMVILCFAVFVILAGAMLTLALSAGSSASYEVYTQQSYLSARSANVAAISLAKKAAEDTSGTYAALQTRLQDVLDGTSASYKLSSGATSGVGKTTVTFTKTTLSDGTAGLKITATSPGVGNLAAVRTVTATMQWSAGSAGTTTSYANPFANMRYISGEATYSSPHWAYGAIFNGTTTYYDVSSLGDVTVNGDLVQIANESRTLGGSNDADLYLGGGYNDGAIGFDRWGNASSVGTLYNVSTTRNLHIGKCYNSSSGWNGDSGPQVYCFDTLTVNGNLTVDSNAQVYVKHLYLSGSLSISGGAQMKKLHISGSSVTTSSITSKSARDGAANFTVTYPDDMPMCIGYNTGTADSGSGSWAARTENDDTIVSYENDTKTSAVSTARSSALNVTGGLLSESQVNDSYQTVYINTGTAANTPVRLVLKPDSTSDHTFTINSNIVVTGSNYLYIYLPDDDKYSVTTVEMNGSIYWAKTDWSPDYNSAPKIIIMEGHKTADRASGFHGTWKLGPNSVLRAYLYTLHYEWTNTVTSGWGGSMQTTWSGDGNGSDKDFFGSALIQNSAVLLSGAVFSYCAPPTDGTNLFAGTPLQNIASGLYGRQVGQGTVKGWSNK